MLRKQFIKPHPVTPDATAGEIDIATVAAVLVTSESPDHPIDLAFDLHRGPGGTRWIAGESGEQTVNLAFDAPQTINQIVLEVEEPLLWFCAEINPPRLTRVTTYRWGALPEQLFQDIASPGAWFRREVAPRSSD